MINVISMFMVLTADARSPAWEYDSIHPGLKLSDDRLVVSCNWRRIFYPCCPQRFDKLWQVLSRDAFLSGRIRILKHNGPSISL